jgi:hypothetical protein
MLTNFRCGPADLEAYWNDVYEGYEKLSGVNGTVEMLSARGLALDWAAVFYKTCPARVSFAN